MVVNDHESRKNNKKKPTKLIGFNIYMNNI